MDKHCPRCARHEPLNKEVVQVVPLATPVDMKTGFPDLGPATPAKSRYGKYAHAYGGRRYISKLMIPFFISFLTCLSASFRSRYNLSLEMCAHRQQLGVLKRKGPRPRLRIQDRLFWILLRRLWPAWSNALVIVKPETVVAWHRAGFRLFWRLRSRPKSLGRPKIDAEVRVLIRRMVEENLTWGAPRIHGELLKLGFEVSERTVSRSLRRLSPPDDARKCWSAFLRNHREAIAATDLLTVPTLTFRVLYCFFVIKNGRRKILHFNVTEHPTGPRIVQQLREAFPESSPYRYATLDGDAKFGKGILVGIPPQALVV